jgi:hypothetical protein
VNTHGGGTGWRRAYCTTPPPRVASSPVRIRPLIAVASALSITVAVQAAYAVPSRTVRELRAAHCCATRCQHQNPAIETAARCCGVDRVSTELATLSPSAKLHPTFLLALACPVSGDRLAGTYVQTSEPPDPVPRASPVFLLTRSLRL